MAAPGSALRIPYRMEIDLSNLPAALRQKMDDIFRRDFDLKVLKAIERQQRIAQQRRDKAHWHGELKPEFEIDPFVDSIWRQFYGHNYTENPDLMKFLAKRNEEIALRARSRKIQVGFTGTRSAPCAVRKVKRGVRFDRGTWEAAR